MVVNRFDVYLIGLDPAIGVKLKKPDPVIISPNEMNCLNTAPMTTQGFHASSRVELQFQDKIGLVLPDLLRSVDKSGLVKKLGTIDAKAQKMISRPWLICLRLIFKAISAINEVCFERLTSPKRHPSVSGLPPFQYQPADPPCAPFRSLDNI